MKCRHHVADALERMAATPGLKCVAKYTARSVPENRAAVGRHCRRVLADVEFLHYSSGLPMGIPLFMWLADIGIEVERVDIVITLSMVKDCRRRDIFCQSGGGIGSVAVRELCRCQKSRAIL